MLTKVTRDIRKRGLIAPGDHVLVAVSGGADSVSLLHVLKELAARMKLTLSVTHLNHRIRGKSAAEDAAFVSDLAGKLRLDAIIGHSNVPALAKKNCVSVEMAARDARYRLFARTANKVGADVVATAPPWVGARRDGEHERWTWPTEHTWASHPDMR